MSAWGVLHGVGMGPGDPDLLTIKGMKLLGAVRRIFAAASSRNDFSHALAIARPHLREDAVITRLPFPMTRDEAVLRQAWRDNAAVVADALRAGEDAAFLTLGDPMVYATFGYLARTLVEMFPEARCASVPGITSFQAAASQAMTPLAEGAEPLLVLPGVAGGEALRQALAASPNVAVLKAYRTFRELGQTLREEGLEGGTTWHTRLGQEGEAWGRGLDGAPETPHYLTLMLVKRDPQRDGKE